ncbi:hypothetical protein M8J76_005301 [Diaphorina citri]|nr:hypothetical protein M8J75_005106 [Diaphorina citri]KAI5726591.1 hypothetical protein M8J76_005301 [Diaphorina citri]KAI5731407.1 hypothetical protein M8J77_009510 [Diaphorina citri]
MAAGNEGMFVILENTSGPVHDRLVENVLVQSIILLGVHEDWELSGGLLEDKSGVEDDDKSLKKSVVVETEYDENRVGIESDVEIELEYVTELIAPGEIDVIDA